MTRWLRRRGFLRLTALAGVQLGSAGARAAMSGPVGGPRRLVVVMLEGGLDGLSVAAPVADPRYRQARPGLAWPQGPSSRALGQGLELAPALSALMPEYRAGRLAIAPAIAMRDQPSGHAAARRALAARLDGLPLALRRFEAGVQLDVSSQLQNVADAILAGDRFEVALLTLDGFDTHMAQGMACAKGGAPGLSTGRLARCLAELAEALLAFRARLGARARDVVVLSVSEMGRSLAENATQGTDDGHASAALIHGDAVYGGRLIGAAPDLAALDRRGGLAATCELETVLDELVGFVVGAPMQQPQVLRSHRACDAG